MQHRHRHCVCPCRPNASHATWPVLPLRCMDARRHHRRRRLHSAREISASRPPATGAHACRPLLRPAPRLTSSSRAAISVLRLSAFRRRPGAGGMLMWSGPAEAAGRSSFTGPGSAQMRESRLTSSCTRARILRCTRPPEHSPRHSDEARDREDGAMEMQMQKQSRCWRRARQPRPAPEGHRAPAARQRATRDSARPALVTAGCAPILRRRRAATSEHLTLRMDGGNMRASRTTKIRRRTGPYRPSACQSPHSTRR